MERRKNLRIPFKADVKLTIKDEIINTNSLNLSQNGICVLLPDMRSIGTQIKVKFNLTKNQSINDTYYVFFYEKLSRHYRIGLKIDSSSQSSIDNVQNYINETFQILETESKMVS